MKLVYQGVAGAYSHFASQEASRLLGLDEQDLEIEGLASFPLAWQAIDKKTIAVLPIENSYAGSIHTNIYHFVQYPDYNVIAELSVAINHSLLAIHTDLSQIKKVYSHPQALAQCAQYCQKHGIEQVVYHDTAAAAEYVSQQQDPSIAAIASAHAGELYDLQSVAQAIQDQQGNTTRFLLVAHPDTPVFDHTKKGKIGLLFGVKDGVGALHECLGVFAQYAINLTKIESLPSQQDPFSYLFWIECEADVESDEFVQAFAHLEALCHSVRVVGNW